jgi:hypothetical protein
MTKEEIKNLYENAKRYALFPLKSLEEMQAIMDEKKMIHQLQEIRNDGVHRENGNLKKVRVEIGNIAFLGYASKYDANSNYVRVEPDKLTKIVDFVKNCDGYDDVIDAQDFEPVMLYINNTDQKSLCLLKLGEIETEFHFLEGGVNND